MRARARWVFWIRGSLIAAICGHWVGNVTFDPDQYSSAGLAFTWRAYLPILVQSALALAVVLILGPASERLGRIEVRRSPARSSRGALFTSLATCQLLLFLLFEVTERIVQREPFTDGLFASGFTFELLFAIGSAVILAALGSIAVRVIRSLRRNVTPSRVPARIIRFPRDVAPTHRVLVVGGVRAPPLLPA